MFNKLREQLKVMFEGNMCRFRKECKLYRKSNAACNSWIERFPSYDKTYCGMYRKIQGLDNRIEKIGNQIKAMRKI